MKVEELMNKKLISINVDSTLRSAMELMKRQNVSRLLVKKNGNIVGIITERDISERLGSWRERKLPDSHIHVSSVYSQNLIKINKEESISKAASLILNMGVSSLVVTDNGNIVGIITKTDLIKSLLGSNVLVNDYMNKQVVSLPLGSTLLQARKLMLNKKIKRIFIVFDGNLVGVLTESDMAKTLGLFRKMAEGKHWDEKMRRILVDEVMKKDIISVTNSNTLADAVKIMLKENISGLPVLKNEKLIGVITKTDLVRAVKDLF